MPGGGPVWAGAGSAGLFGQGGAVRVGFHRRVVRAAGALIAGLVVLACSGTVSGASGDAPGDAAGKDSSSGWPVVGFTHTQYTADYGDRDAIASVHRALRQRPLLQNQHIMGFGALNPEPSPGRYEFDSLDERIDLIRKTGGIPIITLCCAPDWMKGGKAGETDWRHIERAPEPEHYQDFANLAAKVAQRYPDVTHYIVWNELKGFFDESKQRWNYEGYTAMYNKVYKALKAVNPKIKVGGPYPVMADFAAPSELHGPWGNVDQRVLDALRYWNRHKAGADFVVVDGTAESEAGMLPDDFGAQRKFAAIGRWLHRNIKLPIWWAEWYPEPVDSGWSDAKRLAVSAVSLMELTRSGAETVLYWSRQEPGQECPVGCLWTDPRVKGGGQPTRMLALLQGFARWFPRGVETVHVRAAPSSVRVLAQPARMLVVNTSAGRVRAQVDGRSLDLAPYEVRWISRT